LRRLLDFTLFLTLGIFVYSFDTETRMVEFSRLSRLLLLSLPTG
jgi:hypothetical protein